MSTATSDLPLSLIVLLVQLAPFTTILRHILEVFSWRKSWYQSWLAIAFYWAICFFLDPKCLPILVLVLVLPLKPSTPSLTTEKSLQTTLTDLTTIFDLLPSLPPRPPSHTLLRIFTLTYLPYLLFIHLISFRIFLAIAGTFFLTIRAPFTHLILAIIFRSAWLRWSLRHIASFLTGHPLPPILLSHQPTSTTPTPAPSFRFLFTIYENQRWWMGLDWTAALLPGERPSWCSAPPSYHPVSPPNAFTLPPPTTVTLANGKGGRIKRTATWRWEESEWKVITHTEGGSPNRIERPIPDETLSTSSASGSRLLKAAGKMRESGIIGSGGGVTNGADNDNEFEDGKDNLEEDQMTTDLDGWIYADNKWEGSSNKGGMGKYTRYRRWTRVAVVSERVELVADELMEPDHVDTTITPPDTNPDTGSQSPGQEVTATGTMVKLAEEESPLKQRLRRALSKPSNG